MLHRRIRPWLFAIVPALACGSAKPTDERPAVTASAETARMALHVDGMT